MYYRTAVAAIFAAAALPSMAGAVDAWGTVTLGYGHTSISDGGGDANSGSIDFSGGVKFNPNLTLNFDASWIKFHPEDYDLDTRAFSAALNLDYRFDNGLLVGAYLEHGKIDEDDLSGDLSATSWGLKVGYATDELMAVAFYGKTETDPDLPSGVDVKDWGLNLGYRINDRTSLAANYVRTRLEGFGDHADIDYVDLGASHQLTADWGVFGGASFASLDEADLDVNTFGLGASYYLGNVTQVPATISLEYARSELKVSGSSAHTDTIRLGLTMPLGGKGAKLPLNSVAGAVQNPRHDALSSMILSVF